MLLVCPSCASTYNISSEKLGKGRTVRCKHCQACWYAAAPDAFDAAVAPILAAVEEEAQAMRDNAAGDEAPDSAAAAAPAEILTRLADETPAAAEEADAGADGETLLRNMSDLDHEPRESSDLDGEVVAISARAVESGPAEPGAADEPAQPEAKPSLLGRLAAPLRAVSRRGAGAAGRIPAALQTASRKTRTPAPRRTRRLGSALPYGAFAASCLVVAALAGRGPIMSAAPGTGRLYAALGLTDESGPVAIISVRSEIGAADGGDVLLVEGELASRAGAPVHVPGLRVVVRDEQGVELYAWPAQSLKSMLEPGERTVFRARLASPPPAGKTVQVKFETGQG